MSDLLDFLWNVSQEHQLTELRNRLDQAPLEHDLAGGDRKVLELAAENMELKLRLGLLVRLLINKGLITAEEYAALIKQTHHSRRVDADGPLPIFGALYSCPCGGAGGCRVGAVGRCGRAPRLRPRTPRRLSKA